MPWKWTLAELQDPGLDKHTAKDPSVRYGRTPESKYTKGTDPNLDKILGFLGQIPQVWLDKKICGKIRHQKTWG